MIVLFSQQFQARKMNDLHFRQVDFVGMHTKGKIENTILKISLCHHKEPGQKSRGVRTIMTTQVYGHKILSHLVFYLF